MNNSLLTIENVTLELEPHDDRQPWLRHREQTLIRIIEAIHRLQESPDWKVLKDEIFDGVVENLEKDMLNEAKSEKPEPVRLASLKGQFTWAHKYADMGVLAQFFKMELQGIRKNLQ